MAFDSRRGGRVVRFGVFEIDTSSGELRRSGLRVPLQQQPLTILLRLLARPGDVVTRDDLRGELWPDASFGDFDHGLNAAVKRLRDALDDSPDNPRFVETLPKRGYRFIAPVVVDPGAAPTAAAEAAVARRFPVRTIGVVLSVLIVAAGGLLLWLRLFKSPDPPASGLSVLVADFTNKTGDPVFDDTLKQAVRSGLEQSPSFRLVSRERVRQTLQQMTRSADEGVTGDVALEICQRVGADVVLRGSIAPIGTRYAVYLEATACEANSILAEQVTEAADREHVLGALGGITVGIRRRLGESTATLRRFSLPIAEATTASLEALKAFTVAEQIRNERGNAASEPYYRRALDLDPDFALAYARLAAVYGSTRRMAEATRLIAEAAARRGRITERERFYVDSLTCIPALAANPDACTDVAESWKRTYPFDPAPYMALSMRYNVAGNYERALTNGREAVRLAPENWIAYTNLLTTLMSLGQTGEAKRIGDAAFEQHHDAPRLREFRFLMAFASGDRRAMAEERDAARGTPEEFGIVGLESQVAAFEGRLNDARELRISAETLAAGRFKEWRGDVESSMRLIDAAVERRPCMPSPRELALEPGVRGEAHASVMITTTVLCGDREGAERLLSGFPANRPLVPVARALIAVYREDRAGIAHLQPPSPAEFGSLAGFRSLYLRALAYLHEGDGRSAAAEFQRIIDHRGVAIASPLYPLAYVQQARAYTLAGDVANARRAYESFFRLWEHADPDVPILLAAKDEYRKLALSGR